MNNLEPTIREDENSDRRIPVVVKFKGIAIYAGKKGVGLGRVDRGNPHMNDLDKSRDPSISAEIEIGQPFWFEYASTRSNDDGGNSEFPSVSKR